MITDADLISLETRARDYMGESTAKFWAQATVFRHINAEVDRLVRLIIDLDVGYFETSATVTPTSAAIAVPFNCYKITSLEANISGIWRPLQWTHTSQKRFWQNPAVSGGLSAGVAARFSGNTIVVESGVGDVTTVRYTYVRAPGKMRYEAMQSVGTTDPEYFEMGSSAGVIDDTYNGDRIVTLSGTGSGYVYEISDYTGATRLAYVDSWTVNPDTTTYYSTLLPDPLDNWTDLVALGAALRGMIRTKDDRYRLLREQYQFDLDQLLDSCRMRQTAQPRRINFVPYEDE